MTWELDRLQGDSRLGAICSSLETKSEAMLWRLHASISSCFARAEPRERALQYLLGLAGFSDDKGAGRRNVASYSQETRADGAQRLLTTVQWDDASARRRLREVVRSSVGGAGHLLVVEVTFPKKGNTSAAVEYQYRPESGRPRNCQSALVLLHITPGGRLFILDLCLYVPPSWISDSSRRARGRIPDGLDYRSRPAMALDMIRMAVNDGFRPDRVYLSMQHRDKAILLESLRQRQIPHLAGLNAEELDSLNRSESAPVPWAGSSGGPVTTRSASASSRDGLDTIPYHRAGASYPLSNADLIRGSAELRYVERRWRTIRRAIQMDRYEVRSWRGWHRHMTFVMMVQLANELATIGPVDGDAGS
jgi:hypothetical protein